MTLRELIERAGFKYFPIPRLPLSPLINKDMTIHNPQPETHQSITPRQMDLVKKFKNEYDFLESRIQLTLQTKGYLALLESLCMRFGLNVSALPGSLSIWVPGEEYDHFTSLLDPRWVSIKAEPSYDSSIPRFDFLREGITLSFFVTNSTKVSL